MTRALDPIAFVATAVPFNINSVPFDIVPIVPIVLASMVLLIMEAILDAFTRSIGTAASASIFPLDILWISDLVLYATKLEINSEMEFALVKFLRFSVIASSIAKDTFIILFSIASTFELSFSIIDAMLLALFLNILSILFLRIASGSPPKVFKMTKLPILIVGITPDKAANVPVNPFATAIGLLIGSPDGVFSVAIFNTIASGTSVSY